MCEIPTITTDGSRCTSNKNNCTFLLVASHAQTMTKGTGGGARLMYADNYQIKWSNNGTVVSDDDLKDVVVADGYYPIASGHSHQRNYASCTSGPALDNTQRAKAQGPCLRLHVGQNITVHVKNDLPTESLTIHWHGLEMRGTPYMDGVGLVSQCPILPGQTFTYTFTPNASGTYWYHSHIGSTRTMGILGALVVRYVTPQPQHDERVLVLQDWNHDVTSDQVPLGIFHGGDPQSAQKVDVTKSKDGALFSAFEFQSGLINGRGRVYTGNMQVHTKTPLDVIEVEAKRTYRFRVIGAGSMYPFRVAVEGHTLTMVATDGHDFNPVPAESFIINPGERYDFLLTANMTAKQQYLIYAETLQVNLTNPTRHVAEAVLRVKGASEAPPPDLPTARDCGDAGRPQCVIVNCPYHPLPQRDNTNCVLLEELNSATDIIFEQSKQVFLNFGFSGPGGGSSSVNGISFTKPSVAAILQPNDIPERCTDSCLNSVEKCSCAHAVTLDYGTTYDFVLTNIGEGRGFSHPVHIHGFSFYVMKTAYPVYDLDSYKIRYR
nr:hypothetical protein BaRGS_006280 [Batillaria attramentaria]